MIEGKFAQERIEQVLSELATAQEKLRTAISTDENYLEVNAYLYEAETSLEHCLKIIRKIRNKNE